MSVLQLLPAFSRRKPLNKKKKLDSAIVKARDERKKKKIERQIRKLEKVAKQLNPISEIKVPYHLVDEKEKRLRYLPALSQEELELRILLKKRCCKKLCKRDIVRTLFYVYEKWKNN